MHARLRRGELPVVLEDGDKRPRQRVGRLVCEDSGPVGMVEQVVVAVKIDRYHTGRHQLEGNTGRVGRRNTKARLAPVVERVQFVEIADQP